VYDRASPAARAMLVAAVFPVLAPAHPTTTDLTGGVAPSVTADASLRSWI